ncbi:hypothetical protein GCM10022234_01870 [Aeromicrobium panaciterrae]|uniref:DUF6716 putative glycosyltransferase n=1 Tax=Aeromicrobium panaciterrae TaxID=363861 RepID=UPI0031D482A5
MTRSALLIAAFDSQLKWCAGIRDELVQRGTECRVVVPDTRSALSVQQIKDAGFEHVDHLAWDDLVAEALRSDIVVCSLAGPMTQRLSIDMATARRPGVAGPIVVSGWVGIIIEKVTAGYLDRAGTDVIAVNSAHDLEYFRDTAGTLGLPSDNLVLTGLPFLSSSPQPERGGEIKRVLFADQPTVPSTPVERLHVYQRLIAYALEHPDRDVILKPRHRRGEDTFHRMAHHPADLLRGRELPPNFHLDYTPITEQLPTTDLLLTMSSTACLEALDRGCRVALVLDLGVHERFGNHVFLDSGLLRTFEEISKDEIGTPSAEWMSGYFGGRTRPANQTIADRIEALIVSGERPSHAVWDTSYFRGATDVFLAREAAQPAFISAPWARRIRQHGRVFGTAAQAGHYFLPPVILRPIRRLLR